MAKKTDEGSLLILAIVIIIGIIYYIILWILANWIPILIVLILIGSIYFIFQWLIERQKKIEDKKRVEFEAKQRKQEEIERIEYEKKERDLRIKRKEIEENERNERERNIRDFEEQQTKLGLFKFVNRFNQTSWGSLQEVEIWKKEDDAEKIKDLLITKIVDAIKNFKPIRKWENEDGYHKELLGYLSHDFPEIKYEFQIGSSRPDLVIKNIAIELKGPTDNGALDTLTTKCLKYSKYYDHLIIVLFEPRFSEGHFKEIREGINQYFPHVIIIRK
ncbi:hypothetical protein [Methanoregula sp.]|jgi:hypothetical protein|uniref:hypothetical protein n=1 Tax=Methanoregula sp. TaxID=2052170 RepID=UPI003C1BFB00